MTLRHAFIFICTLLSACVHEETSVPQITDGDARQGLATLKKYECTVCHVIPGVRGAQGYVGPSLAAYQRNLYIAGKYPNTPAYLIPWIMDAPALAPLTAMPSLGLSVDEARDIAAYLYTLH
jgi:mono/diheme cytochrome c family protein